MNTMTNDLNKGKGIRISKGDTSSLDAIRNNTPHWIHHTKEDPNVMGGLVYLPACDCSECGFTVNIEKKTCPHCGARMWK